MNQQLIFGDAATLTQKLLDHIDSLTDELATLKQEQRKVEGKLTLVRKHYWQHLHDLKAQEDNVG